MLDQAIAMVSSVIGTARVSATRNAPAETSHSSGGRIAASIDSGRVMHTKPISISTKPTPRRIQVSVLLDFFSSWNSACAETTPGSASAMV